MVDSGFCWLMMVNDGLVLLGKSEPKPMGFYYEMTRGYWWLIVVFNMVSKVFIVVNSGWLTTEAGKLMSWWVGDKWYVSLRQ